MALYALGDLHLSFQSDKSMDVFGGVWKHHERKIEKHVKRLVKPEDTLVLTGDHSRHSASRLPQEWSNAGKIWLSSRDFPGGRSCLGGTMTCFGTQRKQPA